MYRVPLLFLFLALPILLTPAESTAQQLDRISVAQRSDGGGLVLRYHLTSEPDSYTLHRPRADLIQMNLYGVRAPGTIELPEDRKSTHLNSSHVAISHAVGRLENKI